MKNKIMFSIICPVYNSEKTLLFSANSIIKQTYYNWELILIDDGSIDSSAKMCDELASTDKRIRVIHERNKGQSTARANGFKLMRGDYVLFLDSDDYYKLDALEQLEKEISDYSSDVILFDASRNVFGEGETIYDLKERKIFNVKKDILEELFSKRISGYFWTYCFKRKMFDISNNVIDKFETIKYSEDVYLIYKLVTHNASSLTIMPQVLYTYVSNTESITQNQTLCKVKDRFVVFDEIYSDLNFVYDIFPNKGVKAIIGWTYLSYLSHASKELDYKLFVNVCVEIRNSFLFKKMGNFKKDHFNSYMHFLFKFKLYNRLYLLIRNH